MTLKELLENDGVSGLTVLNEKADLDRTVSTIESTETPDVFSYVDANCLILTTAMIYKDNQQLLCDLIVRLNALPCAGLAIKMGRFIDRLDEKVIEKADQLGFPIIMIPRDETLGKIYHRLLSLLWNNQNKGLLEALNIKRKLYNLVINGATLKRMLDSINSSIGKHVLIADMFGEICGRGGTTKEEEKTAVKIVQELNQEERSVQGSIVKKEEGRQIIVYPIKSISGSTHFLLVFDDEKQMPVSTFVLEEIVLLLEIIFYKNLFSAYNEIQLRDNFLKRMINAEGEDLPSNQIMTEGKRYGLKNSACYTIIIGKYIHFEAYRFNAVQFMQREEKYILGYEYFKKKVLEKYGDSIVFLGDIDHWQYILLLQGSCEGIEKKLEHLAQSAEEAMQEKIVFSMGDKIYDIASAPLSYREVKENLDGLNEKEFTGHVLEYRSKSALDLLRGISKNQSRSVCEQLLGELAFPEDQTLEELRNTLKVFLECQCSIAETSNRLYLHRNTVRYRIKKCESILGKELSDPEYCFELQVGLILSETEKEK